MKRRHKFEIPFLGAIGIVGYLCSRWIRASFDGSDRVVAYLIIFGSAFIVLRGVHWLVSRYIGDD